MPQPSGTTAGETTCNPLFLGETHIKITLIHNPEAGTDGKPTAKQLLRMMREAGHRPRYQSSKEKKWTHALADKCDLIAVAGGDGTVGKVARRLIGSRTPIGVLPTGTANNIATTLGLTGVPLEQLVGGWGKGRCVNFDAGIAKGPWGSKSFIEGFGIGLFAETMFRIEDGEGQVAESKTPETGIRSALKLLYKHLHNDVRSKNLTVRLDGNDLSGRYVLLEVLNLRYIGPNLELVPGAQFNDGLLDVVLVGQSDRAKLSRYIANRMERKASKLDLPIRRGRHLQAEWQRSPVHIDDTPWPEDDHASPILSSAIDVKIDPGALVFLLPKAPRQRTASSAAARPAVR